MAVTTASGRRGRRTGRIVTSVKTAVARPGGWPGTAIGTFQPKRRLRVAARVEILHGCRAHVAGARPRITRRPTHGQRCWGSSWHVGYFSTRTWNCVAAAAMQYEAGGGAG